MISMSTFSQWFLGATALEVLGDANWFKMRVIKAIVSQWENASHKRNKVLQVLAFLVVPEQRYGPLKLVLLLHTVLHLNPLSYRD